MAKKKPKPAEDTSLVDGTSDICIRTGGPHDPIEDFADDGVTLERFCSKCKTPLPLTEAPVTKSKSKKKSTTAKKPATAESVEEKPKRKTVEGKLALEKDPRVYRRTISRRLPDHKRFVGLDLATNCGIAFCDIIPGFPVTNAKIVGGVWDLSLGDYDTGPLRHVRLKQFLAVLQPDLIVFEDVKYVGPEPPPGTSAKMIVARAAKSLEFIGGLKTTLTTWCEERGIPCQGLGIQVLKRWLTGKGVANKEDMLLAANTRFGANFDIETYEQTGADNIADAMAACGIAVQAYSEGLTGPSPVIEEMQEAVDE
jgi:hypothetical protein